MSRRLRMESLKAPQCGAFFMVFSKVKVVICIQVYYFSFVWVWNVKTGEVIMGYKAKVWRIEIARFFLLLALEQ